MSENIKQLSERDKVRKRISVWLGSSNHTAVLHCIKELVGNSADEIGKGNGDRIEITLQDEKTVTLKDNCKGLPVEGTNENGVENYELLFEHLFAGTKYENGVSNNDYTIGVNGVFLCVLTYASEEVEYTIARPDGNIYRVSYKKGILNNPFQIIGKSDTTFTEIKFKLDDEVFDENYYTFKEISEIADEQASLLINGSIVVEDKKNSIRTVYEYKNGIEEFLERQTERMQEVSKVSKSLKEVSHKLEKENVYDDLKIEIVFKYTREDEDKTTIEFLNSSNLIHHGTIYEGLVNGFRTSINKFIRENNMYKKNEKQITKEDVLVGLNYVVNFKSYFPVYANQTKFASEVTYYKDIMQEVIKDHFETYSIENKVEMERIANQVLGEKRARESAEKTRLTVRQQLQAKETVGGLQVSGLEECDMKNSKLDEREVWICEGKSAAQTMTNARDDRTMGTIALRGRFISSLKASVERVLGNEEAKAIIKALGCGIEIPKEERKKYKGIESFDISKLRYGKVVIATDEDDAGKAIALALITFFYKFIPEIIKQDRLYISRSPRYRFTKRNGEEIFAYNEKEKEEIVQRLNDKNNKYDINIVKGLGELNQDIYWDYVMNPETRYIEHLTYNAEDHEKMANYFEMFMGEDVTDRKEFIYENIVSVNLEEILD